MLPVLQRYLWSLLDQILFGTHTYELGMDPVQKLRNDYPWIHTPLVVSAPMRLITLAESATEVSKAGKFPFCFPYHTLHSEPGARVFFTSRRSAAPSSNAHSQLTTFRRHRLHSCRHGLLNSLQQSPDCQTPPEKPTLANQRLNHTHRHRLHQLGL